MATGLALQGGSTALCVEPLPQLPPAGLPKEVRWASAEGVSQNVIAAVLLFHYDSVEEIVPKPMQLDLGLVRAAPKSAKTAKTNATRPRPGPGGAEIRKDR